MTDTPLSAHAPSRASAITGPLRRAINLKAHAAGLAHAEALKARLLARVAELRASGATYERQKAAIEGE